MRITNKMITNNMMYNINKNKNNLSVLDDQYSSGKKIQRPSQDPIIAARALKLRTNLSELNQYYEKNIPDAMSWMDITESALTNINTVLTKLNTSCVQGASDTLTVSDRSSIIENLEEFKQQIYQEGNTDYAGRYVFTGYKTDTSLIFKDASTTLDYNITEKFSGSDIDSLTKVTGEYSLNDYNTDPTLNDFSNAPNLIETHRIRLAYDNLENTGVSSVSYKIGGVVVVPSIAVTVKSVTDLDAYSPASGIPPALGTINYIPETGELIMPTDVYEALRLAEDITVTYDKNEFKEGDLRPEHYFNCKTTDTLTSKVTNYTKSDQQIQYEINFNQKLTINTQSSDAIQHGLGRDIDEILQAVQDVVATEKKISEVGKMLEDESVTDDQTTSLKELLGQLESALALKNKIMHGKFEQGIAGTSEQQEKLNIAVADLGSRYVRLELTESRLSSQQADFEELLSNNEDADLVETVIKYNSAETIYNASLSVASKVVQNTLLDFL